MADRLFVTYKRKDGVGLSGTIYLPVGYQKGQRVPMLVWAYPQEFVDTDAASQVVGSPNRFTSVTGAVTPAAADAGLRDLRRSDDADRRDRARRPTTSTSSSSSRAPRPRSTRRSSSASPIGAASRVGGHSYGAFMTANLLAHSDLFARRHRAQRRLQPLADAVRLPGRDAHVLGGAGRVREDVAVLARATRSRSRSC